MFADERTVGTLSTFVPEDWECYFHFGNYPTKLSTGPVSLTIDNDWQNRTNSDERVWLRFTTTNNIDDSFICVTKRNNCFELEFLPARSSGRLIWQISDAGYLDCKMPSQWFRVIPHFKKSFEKDVKLVKKPVKTEVQPFCMYYAKDGTILGLTARNKWSAKYVSKNVYQEVSMKKFENKLLFAYGNGQMYGLNVNFDKGDEDLAWTLKNDDYLECKPILAIRENLQTFWI